MSEHSPQIKASLHLLACILVKKQIKFTRLKGDSKLNAFSPILECFPFLHNGNNLHKSTTHYTCLQSESFFPMQAIFKLLHDLIVLPDLIVNKIRRSLDELKIQP